MAAGALADEYTRRVIADGGFTTGLDRTRSLIFAQYGFVQPSLYLLNGYKDTATAINTWYSLYGSDGTSVTTSRPTYTSGFANFDGTNDYIEVAHSASQLLTTGGTLMAWVQVDTQSDGAIIDKSDSTIGGNGYNLRVNPVDLRFAFRINAGTIVFSAINSYTIGAWVHVAVVFTSAGASTFYINGALSSGPTTSASASGITTTNALRVGNRSTATNRPFDGRIGATLVTSEQYTASQMQSYYQNTQGLYL
jgi:hypothetical protein